MSSRTISNRTARRAAERKAAKAAAKLQKLQQNQQPTNQAVAATPVVEPEAQPEAQRQVMSAAAGASATFAPTPGFTEETTIETETPIRQLSEAQLNANRANAQKSHGPVTPEGKAKSSLNAVKTGLTGQTVLLPTDDAIAYQAHLDRHFKQESPATDQEHTLVQMIADAEWRILRIPGLEASIHALGLLKFADLHPDQTDPAARKALITGEILMAYRRDLTNLALQERRLRNQMKSDQAKLKALQDERIHGTQEKNRIQARMNEAIKYMNGAKKIWGKFVPLEFGFEFSLDEIEYCDEILQRTHRMSLKTPCIADLLAQYRSSDTKVKYAA
jgi:hypothetical protein